MKKPIDALTSTRAFAALLVVIYHFANVNTGIPLIDTLCKNGPIAVSYFFVLSGYIMYISYVDNYSGYRNFIQRRIARIVPLYWVALTLSALLFVYSIILGMHLDFNLGGAYVVNALFIQIYFPNYIYQLNTPGWSLCVEMVFYLLFPLFLQLQKTRNKLFIWVTIFLYIASAIIHNLTYAKDGFSLNAFSLYFPALHLNQFLIGMLAAQLFYKKNIKLMPFQSFICLVIIILILHYNTFGLSPHDGLLAPLFAIFIGSVAVANPPFLKIKPLVFLGEISYGIYILQRPIHNYFVVLHKKFPINENGWFLIYLLSLILISAVFYYAIEKPCRKWINNLGNKKRDTYKEDIPVEALSEA